MTFSNPVTLQAYRSIHEFCNYSLNDSQVRADIQQLTIPDLLVKDSYGNTLFLNTINLSSSPGGGRFSHVLQLLAERAIQLEPKYRGLLIFLLSEGDSYQLKPLHKILDINSTFQMSDTNNIGITFFNILNNWARFTQNNMATYFQITKPMLEKIFLCENETFRDQFLTFYHCSIIDNSLTLIENENLYFQPDMIGFRLFDSLIPNAPAKNLIAFYRELRFLHKENIITREQHEHILTSHVLDKEGYSPLHEIISTNCPEKIMDYVNELIEVLAPEQLKAVLLKKNRSGYTAMQQGVNNGLMRASVPVAKLFLSLINPGSVFTLDECVEMVDKLSCIRTKINSGPIHHAIKIKQDHIHKQSSQQNQNTSDFSYVRSTLTYFNSDPRSRMVDPPCEPGYLPNSTFDPTFGL